MTTHSRFTSGFFNPRVTLALVLLLGGGALGVLAFKGTSSPTPIARVSLNAIATAPMFNPQVGHSFWNEMMVSLLRDLPSLEKTDAPRRSIESKAAAGHSKAPLSPVSPNHGLLPIVSQAVAATVSPRVSDLPSESPYTISRGQPPERELRREEPSNNPLEHDPVVQTTTAPTVGMPAVGASFDGLNNEMACNGCIPPDTVGAVGPNHYVQMVNEHFAIYSKTGTLLVGPKAINMLWSSTPNSTCATHNNGDPIVIYDQLADRWLLSQFTVQTGTENYAECIAISQTPDPTGAYWLYQFDESADTFHDYPHIGVWPDGYYMTTNLFPNSALLFSTGAGAWAFERPKMLLGQAARYVYFDETGLSTGCVNGVDCTYIPNGQLPTSVEGKTLPPAGAPDYFVEVDNTNTPNTPPATGLHDEMHVWKFHVDWTNPANSTFGLGSSAPALKPGFAGQYAANAGQPNVVLPIADYVAVPCTAADFANCVPQNQTTGQPPEYLDVLGDRLMFRVTYRNLGDHESLLVSHTALAAADQPSGVARAGVRWYELRGLGTTPTVYQQSTFAPFDPTSLDGPLWRWMGSAAMDHSGNIAIGYSASGPAYFPSLHYAGRLASDPLNELTQGEAKLFVGLGTENAVPDYLQRNRWGDYSNLTVDPNDDCTFWYTNEYINTNQPTDPVDSIHWRTRIGSFKFAQCVAQNTVGVVSVVSRKTHSFAGTFDVPMPLTGGGIEDRSGGANGNHQIVATFAAPVTFTGATTSCGTVASTSTSGNAVTINLTGVPNPSVCTVTLNGVTDGTAAPGDAAFPVNFLTGDTNADRFTDAVDVAQTKSQSGNAVTTSNFREDVNFDGFIDAVDASLVKSKSGAALP